MLRAIILREVAKRWSGRGDTDITGTYKSALLMDTETDSHEEGKQTRCVDKVHLFLPKSKHRHKAAARISALLNTARGFTVEVFTLGFTQGCHDTLTH